MSWKAHQIRIFENLTYLNRVLSIVPPKKQPELCNQALAVSDNKIVVSRSGIIDKTKMNEAAVLA